MVGAVGAFVLSFFLMNQSVNALIKAKTKAQ
jgi:hypothetical protein